MPMLTHVCLMATTEFTCPPPLPLSITHHNHHQRCFSIIRHCTHFIQFRQIHAQALRIAVDQPRLWNTLIRAYTSTGDPHRALLLYPAMPLKDKFTFPFVFKACTLLSALHEGSCIHAHLLKLGFASDLHSLNTLLHFYSRNSRLDAARQVFDEMPKRSIVSWSAMIAGYEQNGLAQNALCMFINMCLANVRADETSLLSVLSACNQCGCLDFGRSVHALAILNGLRMDSINLATALLDMYAKCGSIEDAGQVFDKMLSRNILSWSAMIGGLAMHGLGQEALALFDKMVDEGVHPTSVTFTNILSACAHAGLVDEGKRNFKSMTNEFGIEPRIEHYGCMVDILGRAGLLGQAYHFITTMAMKQTRAIWRSLLGSSCTHGNLNMGEIAMDCLAKLGEPSAGDYVILANLYAKFGEWERVAKLRTIMNDLGIRKSPGCSLIEVDGKVHKFVMEDKSHIQSHQIYEILHDIVEKSRQL